LTAATSRRELATVNESRAIQLCIRFRDPAGFDYLVKKYRREAYGHALALLGNVDDAAEACQESFTSAFGSLPRLEELTAFYPWFYRILRNRCLNMLSRRKTARDFARAETEGATDSPASAISAEDAASSAEERAAVWRTLALVKPEHREILALKYLKDYDYDTLSSLLRIPRGTVMSRLFHARKAFQEAWETECGADSNGGHQHGKL
jgi:RNA polymerase sigma-70 factor (ECF subfamily)